MNASFGIYATAQIPYIFLDSNKIVSSVEFRNDFVKETFFPWQVSGAMSVSASKTVKLKVEYTYNTSYYFTSQYAGIGLTINFWNGRKKK